MAFRTVLSADILMVCNIVIPAAYLYSEGCIVSEVNIRDYNNVSSAVLILRPPDVLPPQRCSYLGVCIDSIGQL